MTKMNNLPFCNALMCIFMTCHRALIIVDVQIDKGGSRAKRASRALSTKPHAIQYTELPKIYLFEFERLAVSLSTPPKIEPVQTTARQVYPCSHLQNDSSFLKKRNQDFSFLDGAWHCRHVSACIQSDKLPAVVLTRSVILFGRKSRKSVQ